ncbi:hypothetical protein IW262DRAFT_1468213 [Armillaria fumosa]|nr:hypothetical protein IW262DRAFT_1468213 [Armillaria fumosa]
MLIDCMELSRDGSTQWIPRDIPNIDHRIEPLLRLEILFPDLCRKYPSRLFGEHNMDFSKKLSNTLSITLSTIDDAHIQKPREHNQVIIDALADNEVHHPIVWEKLLDHYVDKVKLIDNVGDSLTIEMCLNLVTSIYLPKDSPPKTYTCTLVYALITSHKKEILTGLLAFFLSSEPHNVAVDLNSHQPHPFHHDSMISKCQLLHVTLHAIHKDLYHAVNPPSKEWWAHLFWATLSYIKSDLFSGHTLSNSEYSEIKDLFWACHAYALVCMGIFIGGGPKYGIVGWKTDWANKAFFLNILGVIDNECVADAPVLPPSLVRPGSRCSVDSIIEVVAWLLGQAFKHGIPSAYEAFQEKRSLGYIAEKSSLHPDFIEGFCGYITGLSDAKRGKFPDIQSDKFPDQHIQNLHQALVIRCICASITHSSMLPCPILSALASIAPYHNQWSNILQTLNSPDHEYSVQCYALHATDKGTQDDVDHWRRDMKEIVSILAECLEEEKGCNMDNNQPSMSMNHLTGRLETHHGYGWTIDPNTDVELGVVRSGNVDAT